jgi:type III secretory pathway component EscR
MEMTSMVKDLIGLQKQAANNLFDAMALFLDQAERTNRYFANQMEISNEAQEYVDQWRTIFKEGRDESRRFINKSFNSMEDYFAALGPNKPSEKKKSGPKT